MAPLFDFVGGQRAPFTLVTKELVIGRGADCGLRVESATASERHARVTVDASGKVFIQDLDTQTGTLRNGNYVYGVQQLEEGDQIDVGGVVLMYRAAGASVPSPGAAAFAPVTGAMAAAPVRAAAAPAAAPARAGADDRTRMPVELPPEVRAVLAAREAQAKNAPAPPPPVQAGPSGVIVGTPEPEPDNFRTVQMQAPDLAALGIDPASLPGAAKPAPAPSPKQQPVAKRTMMGMGVIPPASLGYAPTTELPATNVAKPKAAPQQATMMAPAPVITQQPVSSAPPPQQPLYQQEFQPPSQPDFKSPDYSTPQEFQDQTPYPQQPYPPANYQQAFQQQPQAPSYTAPVGAGPPKTAPMAAVVPQPVPYEETQKTNPLPNAGKPYTPPQKGAFGSFSRAIAFMGQIFTLARQHKALFSPLTWDLGITTVIMAIFAVADLFIPFKAEWQFYAMMGFEGFVLYFVDYSCNALTASLMYDFATTGQASMATAGPRVRKALPGILTFAAVSALLDVLSTYARERNDLVAKIVLRVLRAIWTTATYVIMPALVIEGVSFGAAFKRSKELMDHDPTGVGAGVVAMSITSYIVAIICFPLAYVVMRALSHIHPAIGALGGMLIINLYWAVSGWLKISYATCFYIWARECERVGGNSHALAPMPLRAALDAA